MKGYLNVVKNNIISVVCRAAASIVTSWLCIIKALTVLPAPKIHIISIFKKASMNIFTIRDIENLSRIKAHTLRVWEQRYGIIRPLRKQSNHRTYGVEDLRHILRIASLYHQGYKISRIAEMSTEEINAVLLEFARKGNHEVFVNQMVEASIDFDEDRFRNTLENVSFSLGMQQAIIEVIYPFLTRIGMLWVTGNVIPSQEHFSSNLIRNMILSALQKKPGIRPRPDLCFVLLCPEGEFHEIPLIVIQYILKQKGIPVIYFGVNTRIDHLRELLDKRSVTHIFVHMITNMGNVDPEAWIRELQQLYPHVKVLAGGASFSNLSNKKVTVFTNLKELLDYLSAV